MAGLWLSSRFDEKPSKNAEISLNLTTQITNLLAVYFIECGEPRLKFIV